MNSIVKGWDDRPKANDQMICVGKMFGDGPDVIVSISMKLGEYTLTSNAESRTSGPSENVIGKYRDLAEALEALRHHCREWDESMEESNENHQGRKYELL